MTAKGLAALQAFASETSSNQMEYIVAARDPNTSNDYYDEIIELAAQIQVPVFERSQSPPPATHLIAVSWRWLISAGDDQQLIVFHDSLLPRYRGFSPLPSALINGERDIGVTALFASEEYDRGPVIAQQSIEIEYPVKVAEAIELLLPCYRTLVTKIAKSITTGNITGIEQNEADASYSLWRDESDYFIEWTWDANRIKRFVDAVGYPYKGAATTIDGEIFRVLDCTVLPDVKIEGRAIGKVIFMHGESPVVVCGNGLIKILKLIKDHCSTNALPLQKFRTRFV